MLPPFRKLCVSGFHLGAKTTFDIKDILIETKTCQFLHDSIYSRIALVLFLQQGEEGLRETSLPLVTPYPLLIQTFRFNPKYTHNPCKHPS